MMSFEEIKKALSRVDVSQVCDALDACRVISPDIKLLSKADNFRMIGKALTVSCGGDLLPVIKALDLANKGDVLVVQTSSRDCAVAGEIFTYEAIRKDLAGIIIDGFCRDIHTIRELSFPFFARGCRPNAGTKSNPGNIGGEITCGNIQIFNAEMVFADPDGIVILSLKEASDVISLSQQIKAKEQNVIRKIQEGTPLTTLLNFHEHYQNVIKNIPSALSFNTDQIS